MVGRSDIDVIHLNVIKSIVNPKCVGGKNVFAVVVKGFLFFICTESPALKDSLMMNKLISSPIKEQILIPPKI